jgi:hypothetical protein
LFSAWTAVPRQRQRGGRRWVQRAADGEQRDVRRQNWRERRGGAARVEEWRVDGGLCAICVVDADAGGRSLAERQQARLRVDADGGHRRGQELAEERVSALEAQRERRRVGGAEPRALGERERRRELQRRCRLARRALMDFNVAADAEARRQRRRLRRRQPLRAAVAAAAHDADEHHRRVCTLRLQVRRNLRVQSRH